jgi:hypothetical protein
MMGFIRTTHIPFNMKRIAVVLTPFLLNTLFCGIFMFVRPEATSLMEERERAQRSGMVSLSSGDPYMLIAGRPLRQWNEWHGGESVWVKIYAVLNGPAVIAAKRLGDRWDAEHAFSGTPTYRHASWLRAYIFAGVSSVQWLLIGVVIARLLGAAATDTKSSAVRK